MTPGSLPDMYHFYGAQVILLIAAALYAYNPNLAAHVRRFRRQVAGL